MELSKIVFFTPPYWGLFGVALLVAALWRAALPFVRYMNSHNSEPIASWILAVGSTLVVCGFYGGAAFVGVTGAIAGVSWLIKGSVITGLAYLAGTLICLYVSLLAFTLITGELRYFKGKSFISALLSILLANTWDLWVSRPRYVGQYKDGKRHGHGTYWYQENGCKYVGEWKDDDEHGHGTYTNFGGRQSYGACVIRVPYQKYVGEYKDGKRHGQGTFITPETEYVGEWKDDKKHGHCSHTDFTGQTYVGEAREGKILDQGTFKYPTGTQFTGENKGDKINGQGTFIFPTGDKYVGDIMDNSRHGQGTYTLSSGEKCVGEWKEGKVWDGVLYDKDGNVFVIYSKGVETGATQS